MASASRTQSNDPHPGATRDDRLWTPTPPIRDLQRLGYAQGFEVQQTLNQRVIDGDQPSTILLVEHDPVITLTRRQHVREHLLADDKTLSRLGIDTQPTNRGGDITYHGPGQLVVYPILRLADYRLNLSSYMRLLEQVVIDTAEYFGITAHRECGATGVWVKRQGQPDAKLCAMGVRIRKNVTLHGLALNVDPNLDHFKLIVPCGLADRSVTSLRELLGDKCPSMAEVKAVIGDAFVEQLRQAQQGASAKACQADTNTTP